MTLDTVLVAWQTGCPLARRHWSVIYAIKHKGPCLRPVGDLRGQMFNCKVAGRAALLALPLQLMTA